MTLAPKRGWGRFTGSLAAVNGARNCPGCPLRNARDRSGTANLATTKREEAQPPGGNRIAFRLSNDGVARDFRRKAQVASLVANRSVMKPILNLP